jgi:23S rRNA (adenine2503-C2)-methyltransferase
MLKTIRSKTFANGTVHLLRTESGNNIETTETFLPFYTKDAIGRKQNCLNNYDLGDRGQRHMVGVSTMSGCCVKCKFCATGKLKNCTLLTTDEIVEQVKLMVSLNPEFPPEKSKEFKINYTRMGEPFLNINNVRKAIEIINDMYPNAHHYISTIGIKDSDFSWIRDNITLQISLHSLDKQRRDFLIPYKNKMSIEELGKIRTNSKLKTTVNMTLVKEEDFDINILKEYFDHRYFFIKLSPINVNEISYKNGLGEGIIECKNLA